VFKCICYLAVLSSLLFSVCQLEAEEGTGILTPQAPSAPHINGPKVNGSRPGRPFLYRIPCTGARPLRFAIKGLPTSLKLDESTGIISGRSPNILGVYNLTLEATNAAGKNSRPLKIVIGDQVGLTPQMGWNGWYTHYGHVSDADIRKAADAMVASGMADFGYQFISIDDAWERKPGSTDPEIGGAPRDDGGRILTNARFPDMKSLTDLSIAGGKVCT